jgi:hypothetical protein
MVAIAHAIDVVVRQDRLREHAIALDSLPQPDSIAAGTASLLSAQNVMSRPLLRRIWKSCDGGSPKPRARESLDYFLVKKGHVKRRQIVMPRPAA